MNKGKNGLGCMSPSGGCRGQNSGLGNLPKLQASNDGGHGNGCNCEALS
jgi:hypothetical protein